MMISTESVYLQGEHEAEPHNLIGNFPAVALFTFLLCQVSRRHKQIQSFCTTNLADEIGRLHSVSRISDCTPHDNALPEVKMSEIRQKLSANRELRSLLGLVFSDRQTYVLFERKIMHADSIYIDRFGRMETQTMYREALT